MYKKKRLLISLQEFSSSRTHEYKFSSDYFFFFVEHGLAKGAVDRSYGHSRRPKHRHTRASSYRCGTPGCLFLLCYVSNDSYKWMTVHQQERIQMLETNMVYLTGIDLTSTDNEITAKKNHICEFICNLCSKVLQGVLDLSLSQCI